MSSTTLQEQFEDALAALSNKQHKFVLEYLKDLRQTDAAIRAGYSAQTARVQASRLLTKVNIRAAVQLGISLFAMPQAEILHRLSAIARGSLADVLQLPAPSTFEPGGDGTVSPIDDWAIDLKKAQQTGAVHLIRRLKESEHGPEVELYSAHEALRDLAKIHGMFKDDNGILKYLDLSRLSPTQLSRLASGDDPISVLLNNPE